MYHLTNHSLLLVISTSLLLFINTCSAQDLVIHVDAINGEDTESCLQGKTTCATINIALKGISFNGIGTTTTLYISPGNYRLEYGTFNNISGNVNSRFAIIGSGELETIVKCDPGGGLNVSSLDEVIIQSITFIGCSFENQLAISFEVYRRFSYMQTTVHASPATLTFTFCRIVSVCNVTILSSNGSGIIMMNTEEASVIGCTVSLGYYLESYSGSLAVGGIVHLSSDVGFYYITRFSISHSSITDNNYLLGKEDCRNMKATGAIVVVDANELKLDIDSCLIANNSRALFSYQSYNNCYYVFKNSLITSNQNACIILLDNNELNIIIIDTEIIDPHPLIIHSPPSQTDSISFSSKGLFSCIEHYRNGASEINVCVSNSSFDFKELEECADYELQPECIGRDCANSYIYSVCSVKEGECSYSYSYSDNCFCYDNHFNKTNNCGECIEGYSVAINSPYLECVPCNSSLDVLKGWVLLIVLEFIPLTIMIALIAILNVNLNQGSLKAYILFCQLFTIPIPSSGYPSWVGLYNYTHRLRDFALLPFTIWNLGFISFPSCNLYSGGNECSDLAICISQNTTPLGAIAFWYVIAFYPFLLLAFLYGYVVMYNKGNRCVVCTGRPVHRFMAVRFWRTFDIQPSFSHTIASVYVLCFTQLVAISLKFFNSTYASGPEPRFFYDGSQKYFDKTHGAAFLAGLFVLFVFVFLPVTYLCVYPFKWFQKCLNKLKFKKDLLVSVTDVFIGPYKNGTNDTWDYRYFAGLAFALQFSQLIPFYLHTYVINFFGLLQTFHISFSGFYVILIVLFRPYKKMIHNLTEIIFHLVLIIFSSFSFLYTCGGKQAVNYFWIPTIFVLYFFLVVACIYWIAWIVMKVKYAVSHQLEPRQQPQELPVIINDHEDGTTFNTVEEDDGELSDRLLNPERYEYDTQLW